MKPHCDKLSLRQPTGGTSTATATGFSNEQVEIFFDLYEKGLAAHDYQPSRIFNVDETGLTVVRTKQPKILAFRANVQIGAKCGRKGVFNNNFCMPVLVEFLFHLQQFLHGRMPHHLLARGTPPHTTFKLHQQRKIHGLI
jgi:hypothetical protein